MGNKSLDVNLNGVFNCCRAVINDMIAQKRGKIINISSAFARYYSSTASSHYMVTKTAVLGLTRAISGETCRFGINCNAICPGRAWTEMTESVPKEVNDAFMATKFQWQICENRRHCCGCAVLASEMLRICTELRWM